MRKMVEVGIENLQKFEFKSVESFRDCFRYICYLNSLDLPDMDNFKQNRVPFPNNGYFTEG